MLRHCCTLLLATLYLNAAAFAQSADTAHPGANALAPVEVRSLRATAGAPYAYTNVDSAMLKKQNLGQDLPFLLQYTPSAVVTSDAGTGVGYTGLRIRGTDGTRINVTLNGVSVNDAESGATFFVDLPDLASSASSIQLQRGAGSATNGAGAFGASMSISNLLVHGQPGAEAAVSFGSFGTQRYTVRGSTGLLAGRFAMDVRLSRISSDGFIQRSAASLLAAQVTASCKISSTAGLRFLYLNGAEQTHQAWNGVPQDSLKTNRTYNELGIREDGTFYPYQTDNYAQQYYQLFADRQFSKTLDATLGLFLTRGKGYYEEYKTGESYAAYGLQDVVTPSGDTFSTTGLARQLWLDNYNYGLTASLLWRATARTSIAFGGQASRYDGRHHGDVIWAAQGIPDHYRWYQLTSRKTDANFYAKAETSAGRGLRLYAEAQVRAVQHEMNGFRKNPLLAASGNYLFFNPRAGLSWDAVRQAGNRLTVYASTALVSKEPNRDDFEAGVLYAKPLPEELLNPEAGATYTAKSFTATLNAYYMRYKNQLVLTGKVNDVGAYTRTNVPESYRAGVELSAAAKPFAWLVLDGNAAFSRNKIAAFTAYADNNDDGTQLAIAHRNTDIAFSPAVVAALGATIAPFAKSRAGKGFELTITGKHVGRQYLDNTQDAARQLSAYTLCDVRLRYGWTLRNGSDIGINLALNNVFNHLYESNGYTYSYISGGQLTTANYYYPQAGFTVLGGLSVRL